MRYNRGARLNTSEVRDVRGRSGGIAPRGATIGGGGLGLAGLVIYLLVTFLGGGSNAAAGAILSQLGQPGQPATANSTQIAKECRTGADANAHLECAVVADINSVQDYWAAELPKFGRRYVPAKTVWFTGQVSTGCGTASSGMGPFYCPADKLVYIDLSFYKDLRSQFGARGGLFVDAYVLAHEYGHHVQDLLGIESRVHTREGPTSDSVRLELQADCFAGVWARHATQPEDGRPPLISTITRDDFARALDTAARIGDDYIQTHLGSGRVNRSQFTHGTSAEREKWLTTGYRTGEPRACDTFQTNNLG